MYLCIHIYIWQYLYTPYIHVYMYMYMYVCLYIYIFFWLVLTPQQYNPLDCIHPQNPAEHFQITWVPALKTSVPWFYHSITSVPWFYHLILVTQLTYLKVWSKEIALKHSTVRTWIFAAFTTRIHFFHFTSQKGNPQKIVQMSTFFRRYQRVLTHDRYRIFQLLNNLKPHFVSLNTDTVFVNELSIHTFSHTQQSANFLYNFLE